MHKKFDSTQIEQKWQKDWLQSGIYKTVESDKPKIFVLDMFPYPSGEGLHVGHPKGYIATDIYSRFKRMTGFNVLHPMGWDAFGLPAENFAIKHKVHPKVAVEKNIANFKSQLAKLGFDYDWDREINTTDPSYYKWTQWIFIQLLKKDLAFQSYEPINWCPGCQTGLANEDLESDGTCERCGSVVEKKPMRQWVLKIREYADRMLEDLDTLTWPEHIKEAQRNWIGRSKGAVITFKLSATPRTSDVLGVAGGDLEVGGINVPTSNLPTSDAGTFNVDVFTTRPDTLYGATYLVLAPEHPLLQTEQVRGKTSNLTEVDAYIDYAGQKAEQDRLDATTEKTGVKLDGITATNPASGEEIPVYIADYVLGGYGTGAIMAVPAHDERDNEFAQKFGIEIKQVVRKVFGEPLPNPVPRIAVGSLVYNSKTDKYLVQYSKEFNNYSFIFGGLEEGETYEDASVRETLEETGYVTKFVRFISEETEAHFYHPGKNVNRALTSRRVLLELTSDLQIEVSHEELSKQEPVWLSLSEIKEKFTIEEDLYCLSQLEVSTPYTGKGNLCNSGEFDGMSSEEAKEKIVEKVGGKMVNTYKIRDWVFSRQRYWGEPIPVVHTEDGQVYPVAVSDLPVTLPEVESYAPTGNGESPLAAIDEWVNVTGYINSDGDFVAGAAAPAGLTLISAKRETNTMPQWAGSSWYYLRFMDNQNPNQLVSKEKEKYWAPVDVYVGGDHAVRHLIYARFWHKFLYDIGVVSTIEPFQRLEFLGFILAEDGRKMSKRWGNVINPDDIVAQVGADTLRIYEMFMGPFENTIAWSKDGVVGARRFLERVHGLSEHITDEEGEETTKALHKAIKKVREDIEGFKFNTAVSSMMICINQAEKTGLTKESHETFIKLLAPFAPHLTEEIWHELGHSTSVHLEAFPRYDDALARDSEVTIGVQINGKVRGDITVAVDASEASVLEIIATHKNLQPYLTGKQVVKVVYKPGKILNLVIA